MKHLPEPMFPDESAHFTAWIKRLESYLGIHFKEASEEHKYELLLKLVAKNDEAKCIVKKYAVSDADAFTKAIVNFQIKSIQIDKLTYDSDT